MGGIITVQCGGHLFGIWHLIKMVFAQVKQEIKSKLVQRYRRRNKRLKSIPCKVTQVQLCNMLLNTGQGFCNTTTEQKSENGQRETCYNLC